MSNSSSIHAQRHPQRQDQKLSHRLHRIYAGLGIIPVLAYLLLFYLLPLFYLLSTSFRATVGSGIEFIPGWTLQNYQDFFSSSTAWVAYGRSLGIALAVVGSSILCAYPLAYTLVFVIPQQYRQTALLLIIVPFWTSFVVRAFAWQLVLADTGLLNSVLTWLTLPPVKLLYTHIATILGLTMFGTMLITLNLCSVMEAIAANLLAASANLGANRWRTFTNVILPLSTPGLLIGCVLTFIIAFGDYIVPTLLGGGIRTVLAQVMVGAVTTHFNIPRAATCAVVMLITILLSTLPVLRVAGQGLNSRRD